MPECIEYAHRKCEKVNVLDRFALSLAVRPKEASDGFNTIGDVMPLTASAYVVACATTSLPFHPMFPI